MKIEACEIEAVADKVATQHGTLPHEERFWAEASVGDFYDDPNRVRNRPLMAAFLLAVRRIHKQEAER